MPGYTEDIKKYKTDVSKKQQRIEENAQDELSYMEYLETVAIVLNRANQMAEDGAEICRIKKLIKKAKPMILRLIQ